MGLRHTLPATLTISCRADGAPAKGVLIAVTLLMRRKNHYFVIAGTTDDRGELSVGRDALLTWANASRSLFPADYEPVSGQGSQFDNRIRVSALTAREIEAALHAHDLFKNVTPYPSGYRGDLEAGHKALVALSPKRIDVSVKVPRAVSGVRVETVSVPYPVVAHTPVAAI
jgi:hypothetical protein